jgi:iron complex outermembrane receptor protein
LVKSNRGQEPSFILSQRPSIFAYSDTGNEYGYSYFRIRGMDQTRVNMTMDGMPLNEGEDMGVYFSNYPDVLSSLHSIKVESGAGISGNGVAGYAGSIDFESVDLKTDTVSSAYINYGSYNTFKSNVEYNSGVKGNWAVHLKATIQQSDGFRENAYNNSNILYSIFFRLQREK